MRPVPKRAARAAGGFTLVEVVMAMFILLIGMSSILGLLTFGAGMARQAELRTRTALAVDAVVADLEENLFPLVVVDGLEMPGEPEEIVDRPVPGHRGLSYSIVAIPNPVVRPELGYPLEYRVEVQISFSAEGLRRTKTFTTLLLREVPFGTRLRRKFVEGVEPQVIESTRR